MEILIFDHFNAHGSIRVRVRVSGLLVRNNTVLLVAHKKRGKKYWLLPGGGVKYGESLEQSLVREFREELGISIEVHNLIFVCDSIEPHGKRHIINITFRCSYQGGELYLGNDRRLCDYGFFTGREIVDKTLYPPIHDAVVSVLKNKVSELYLGRLWVL